jgi:hypothetical protein
VLHRVALLDTVSEAGRGVEPYIPPKLARIDRRNARVWISASGGETTPCVIHCELSRSGVRTIPDQRRRAAGYRGQSDCETKTLENPNFHESSSPFVAASSTQAAIVFCSTLG